MTRQTDVDPAALDPSLVAGSWEVALPCGDLPPSLDFFVSKLGFRIDTIYPAEDPQVASLSGYGLRLRLEPGEGPAGVLRIPCHAPPRSLLAPNGTRIDLVAADPPLDLPPARPRFSLSRAGEGPPPGEGRAGMIYRDLLPDRAGGRFIASHITLPAGGPLSDWAHYHKVAFQMIFCRRGWIKVVYEGQGAPFLLQDGDCVLQPPQIRHRVLESAAGAEVVEIGCPALHETWADAEMDLPNPASQADRVWEGQTFLRHRAAEEPWAPLADGFERQRTAMAEASAGFADVCVIRAAGSRDLRLAPQGTDLAFGFVLEGSAMLEYDGRHRLGPGDAFALPPAAPLDLSAASIDFRLLQVTAPAT